MATDKLAQLVLKIHQNSQQGRIDWQATTRSNAFESAFPRYSVRIFTRGEGVILAILNEVGETVEEVADTDLEGLPGAESWWRVMSEIHEMARRRALGADEAIDALLKELA